MEIIIAKSAGFCFGVKRAVDKVYEEISNNQGQQIYTYGPIIHNEEVVNDLENKGVKVINSKEELRQIKEGIVVIRSHGVEKEIYDKDKIEAFSKLPGKKQLIAMIASTINAPVQKLAATLQAYVDKMSEGGDTPAAAE